MDRDFFELFNRYWWLIFPIFGMTMGLVHVWLRHSRANRALDILKTYAEQGKDPPPELLQGLQGRLGEHGNGNGRRSRPEYKLHAVFLFSALAVGFGFLTFNEARQNPDDWYGLLIPTFIFIALALSNLIALLFMSRPPFDQNGPPR